MNRSPVFFILLHYLIVSLHDLAGFNKQRGTAGRNLMDNTLNPTFEVGLQGKNHSPITLSGYVRLPDMFCVLITEIAVRSSVNILLQPLDVTSDIHQLGYFFFLKIPCFVYIMEDSPGNES